MVAPNMARSEVPPPPARLSPRVKVWFETDEGFSFGFGLIEILQAVGRAGSIKQAAGDLGRSYRHVWDRIKQAEKSLGRSLVEARVGGQGARRSALSDDGRRLVEDFLAVRQRMIEVMERAFSRRSS